MKRSKKKKEKIRLQDTWVMKVLDGLGVEATGEIKIMLRCKKCGFEWGVNCEKGGGMPKDYWVCPYKCNIDLG